RISRASPSAGRTAASVWRVRSDEEHSTTVGRTSAAARWAARTSAARRPRGARGRSGSARLGWSQLDLAWRSNQRRFTVGPVAVGCRRVWVYAKRLTRDVVVVVVLTGFPGGHGSWQRGCPERPRPVR